MRAIVLALVLVAYAMSSVVEHEVKQTEVTTNEHEPGILKSMVDKVKGVFTHQEAAQEEEDCKTRELAEAAQKLHERAQEKAHLTKEAQITRELESKGHAAPSQGGGVMNSALGKLHELKLAIESMGQNIMDTGSEKIQSTKESMQPQGRSAVLEKLRELQTALESMGQSAMGTGGDMSQSAREKIEETMGNVKTALDPQEQSILGRVRDQIYGLGERAKEHTQNLADQAGSKVTEAKERVQDLGHQAGSKVTEAKERVQGIGHQAGSKVTEAKERVHDLGERAQEHTHSIADQARQKVTDAKEHIQDLGTRAKETIAEKFTGSHEKEPVLTKSVHEKEPTYTKSEILEAAAKL